MVSIEPLFSDTSELRNQSFKYPICYKLFAAAQLPLGKPSKEKKRKYIGLLPIWGTPPPFSEDW